MAGYCPPLAGDQGGGLAKAGILAGTYPVYSQVFLNRSSPCNNLWLNIREKSGEFVSIIKATIYFFRKRRGEAFACLGMNACMPVIANASPLEKSLPPPAPPPAGDMADATRIRIYR
ncbi:MAG: hypothetical protein A2W17_04855 [Planctomycetes bacterium RBG_16_41_13]|nr:MAG: hypothetical protein A2W17_04855 [Planctomycetes bacterium RBG_16_41_13]